MKYKLKSWDSAWDNFHYILTVEAVPGKLGKLFDRKEKEEKYYGSGTVWRKFPDMKRCSSGLEGTLSDFFTYIKYIECKEPEFNPSARNP